MKIYREVKSNYLSQRFGENKACARVKENGAPFTPFQVKTRIGNVCPVGYVGFYQLIGMKGHNGDDYPVWYGEPVHFSCDYEGWLRSEIDSSGGIGVDIVSDVPLLACTEGCPAGTIHYIKRRHWHLKEAVGFDKKPIKIGDLIGRGGSTGASSGNHLHRSSKWCDKEGNGLHSDNGFQGCFDDSRFQVDEFVLDHLKKEEIQKNIFELIRQVLFLISQQILKVGGLLGGTK